MDSSPVAARAYLERQRSAVTQISLGGAGSLNWQLRPQAARGRRPCRRTLL